MVEALIKGRPNADCQLQGTKTPAAGVRQDPVEARQVAALYQHSLVTPPAVHTMQGLDALPIFGLRSTALPLTAVR